MNRESTGITSKNGGFILEGDIILVAGAPLYVHSEDGCWVAHTKYHELRHNFHDGDHGKFEVIGNIHDNPELLEKAQ